ncbi:AlpA family transcriptional regulator [Volucribacter psittacicida]|uniref:AlpA family transcriptional regulator n=1 Tax=Volucribacter psittacicida TaxID=203482 RepID=A0A4R1G581_9PAST|nr:helix-turn-helix domain-containing protein [Volucribacter psittacicida]TCK01673.1 AlpA family transcriptional regulator [Volucribacter psittacicida]
MTEQVERRLTIKELRELGNVSHTFIYREIKAGRLAQPEKWGRSSRWKESDVKAWLAKFDNQGGDNGQH